MSSVFGKLCGSKDSHKHDSNMDKQTSSDLSSSSSSSLGSSSTSSTGTTQPPVLRNHLGIPQDVPAGSQYGQGGQFQGQQFQGQQFQGGQFGPGYTGTGYGATGLGGAGYAGGAGLQQSGGFQSTNLGSDVRVLPTVHLPAETLPTVVKEKTLPTEVRTVEQHTTSHMVQPVVREVVQPVETVVKKPIQTAVQEVHHQVVHPKIETVVHQAPSAVVQRQFETTALPVVHKQIEKEAIMLPPKQGAPIPEAPALLKDSGLPTAGTGSALGGSTYTQGYDKGYAADQQLKGTPGYTAPGQPFQGATSGSINKSTRY